MHMPSLLQTGRIIAGIGFAALVIVQACAQAYLIGRPAAAPQWIAESWLVLDILFAGLVGAMFYPKKARLAAFLAGGFILVFSFLVCHLPDMIGKDASGILWQLNAYKTLALVGGCWILAASVPGPPVWLNHKIMVITGWITLSFFLVLAGAAHIKFNGFVQNFIPAYLPWHAFWSYFTAIALLAGGIGLLINSLRRWAALLSGLMILLWFLLLHIPRAAGSPNDIAEWLGVCESFILSGMLFVLSALTQKQTS
jgi:uncharacterized membrane protein YphA (DoxX/SURF4 family)